MFGWYVFDRFGKLYCGAKNMEEAEDIAWRIGGVTKMISRRGTYNSLDDF